MDGKLQVTSGNRESILGWEGDGLGKGREGGKGGGESKKRGRKSGKRGRGGREVKEVRKVGWGEKWGGGNVGGEDGNDEKGERILIKKGGTEKGGKGRGKSRGKKGGLGNKCKKMEKGRKGTGWV